MTAIEKHIERFKKYPQLQKQIGCGYCKEEFSCLIKDSKMNKAKEGCVEYKHHQY